MIMRILHYGEKELRQKSKKVDKITEEIKTLVKNMFETMYNANGIGLAAPQVGINLQIFITDVDNNPLVFINPEIIHTEGKEIKEEGCLSFPGLYELVARASKVVVKAVNLEGQEFKLEAENLLARAIQHEYDHLNGVLIIDRISKARRIQIKKELDIIASGGRLNRLENVASTGAV